MNIYLCAKRNGKHVMEGGVREWSGKEGGGLESLKTSMIHAACFAILVLISAQVFRRLCCKLGFYRPIKICSEEKLSTRDYFCFEVFLLRC